MTNIRIVIINPTNNTGTPIDVPDDWETSHLVPALVNHFKFSPPGGKSSNRYRLIRAKDGYIFDDNDTINSTGSDAGDVFALLTEAELIRELGRDKMRFPPPKKLILGLIVGIIYITFTFPLGITKLGNSLGWLWLRDIGINAKSILVGLFGTPSISRTNFNNLWSAVVVVLLLYFVSLLFLSARHRRIDLVGFGSIFLVGGIAFFHLVAWIGYLLVWLLHIIAIVLGWVFHILGIVFSFLIQGGWWLLVTIFKFLIGSGWWLFALLLLITGILLAVKYRTEFLKAILWIVGISGVGFLLFKLFQWLGPIIGPILRAIGQFLALVFGFIARILGVVLLFLFYVLIGLFVGWVVYFPGGLIIDQFRGAWDSGNGRRGVMLGALSIGTSVALLLLESNIGNVARFYPTELQGFVYQFSQGSNAFLDIIVVLLIIGVSIVGLLRNLPVLRREPGFREFHTAIMISLPLALVFAVGAIWVSSHTEINTD